MTIENNPLADLNVLSNFIHQIINPLNGVIGTVDNLIDGTIVADRREQRLRAIRGQLEWSVVLVRNLAFFTRSAISGESFTNENKTCVIPQLVIEAVQFFQEVGVSRGIDVNLTDRTTQFAIQGSPDLLRQVFMNLIDNAVKYSEPNSVVEITPWVQAKSGQLVIECTNTGVGFSTAESKRIFEAGYRGEMAKTKIASGTGLGLYICKVIVEDIHKGSIEAEYSGALQKVTIRLRFPNWKKL